MINNLDSKNLIEFKGIGGRSILFLSKDNNYIIKTTNKREIHFYLNYKYNINILKKFKKFIPKFYKNIDNKIIMENIFFKNDNYDIIDLKLGCFTKTIFSNYKKQNSKINKSINSTSQNLGFRIDGYKIISENNIQSKLKLRKNLFITETDTIKIIKKFLKRRKNVNNLIYKIKDLINIIKNDSFPFMFFNISLLIGLTENEEEIKIIDFANSYYNYDWNFIYKNLNYPNCIKGLEKLLNIIIEYKKN